MSRRSAPPATRARPAPRSLKSRPGSRPPSECPNRPRPSDRGCSGGRAASSPVRQAARAGSARRYLIRARRRRLQTAYPSSRRPTPSKLWRLSCCGASTKIRLRRALGVGGFLRRRLNIVDGVEAGQRCCRRAATQQELFDDAYAARTAAGLRVSLYTASCRSKARGPLCII